MAKNTYGTGCFMLMHTGERVPRFEQRPAHDQPRPSRRRQPEYALEGSVFIAGAVVQWLRDGLSAIKGSRPRSRRSPRPCPTAGGVMFVPAFTGLGAPYWEPHARGTIVGLTRGTTAAHIARAALESIAFQSAALLEAMSRDARRAAARWPSCASTAAPASTTC